MRRRVGETPLGRDEAWSYALRALSMRALSEHELETRLHRRGAHEEVIRETLERLREYGFVNDAAIASQSAQDPTKGRRMIRAALGARGIDRFVIEDALESRDEEEEKSAARALIIKHRARFIGERAWSRAYAFLARRGFAGSVIMHALEKELEADQPSLEE